MNGAGSGMIHPTLYLPIFKLRFQTVDTPYIALKIRAVLAKIMPQARQIRPVCRIIRGKIASQYSNFLQMFLEQMVASAALLTFRYGPEGGVSFAYFLPVKSI